MHNFVINMTKKLSLLLAVFFAAQAAFAQITITQSSMPSGGDTIRYSSASTIGANLDIKNKGASRSWDYSSLSANGQDLYSYIAANKTPYLLYFFGQIGQKTADSIGINPIVLKNIYAFYTKSSTVFKQEGIGYSYQGIPLSAKNVDDDEVYQFPLSYGDSDVSTYNFRFAIPGNIFTYVQAGIRTNVVDGWGSIKTPYKTYPNVIRVKTIVNGVDSLITQFAKIPVPRRQVIYKWLSADEKIPVLEITGTEVAGVFTANQIRYRDKYLGLTSPLRPRAGFTVNKTSGFVTVDTFNLSDRSTPFATSFNWQITPNTGVVFVGGTSATSRNPRVVFRQKGLYNVSLIATNTFGSDDSTAPNLISIEYGVGRRDLQRAAELVYPNPGSHTLFVRIPGELVLTDLTGREVLKTMAETGRGINVAGLPSGTYFVHLANGRVVKYTHE